MPSPAGSRAPSCAPSPAASCAALPAISQALSPEVTLFPLSTASPSLAANLILNLSSMAGKKRSLESVTEGSQTVVGDCHVEFCLEHSLSVSVRLCLFPSVPRPSTLFFPTILFFSVPFCCVHTFPRPYYTSVSVRLILSAFHIRIRPDLSEFRPCFILFLLLFGYNPYQPNPVTLRPFIVFCLLLYYVPFRPYCSVMYNYDKL